MDNGVRLLRRSDLPGAMRLKEAAGWNQTAADWERLMELEPEGCFGVEQEGELAATATALGYGRELAWIGMVLTAPEFRGRGLARRLMARTMEYLESRGVAVAGLDATDMGIQLYRQFGFGDECIVERWERPAGAERVPEVAADPWEAEPALDGRAFGADRTALLTNLARGEAAGVRGGGYAMGRPGSKAAYFGPCVARSAEVAGYLLRWYLARHPGEAVYWDILTVNEEAVALAKQHGFEPARRLTRMLRALRPGAKLAADNSLVFATAGFECG